MLLAIISISAGVATRQGRPSCSRFVLQHITSLVLKMVAAIQVKVVHHDSKPLLVWPGAHATDVASAR